MKTTEFGNRLLFRVLSILLVLCLVSSAMVSRLYARYATSASAADSARVAMFDVRQTGEFTAYFNASAVPGEAVEKTVTVENNSEVEIVYTVSVENVHKNLPLAFSVEGQSLPYQASIPCRGQNTQTLTVMLSWPESENDPSYSGKVDLLKITLNASQAD